VPHTPRLDGRDPSVRPAGPVPRRLHAHGWSLGSDPDEPTLGAGTFYATWSNAPNDLSRF
jgi:hypothetical protein